MNDNHLDKNWWKHARSIYDFTATDIDGREVSLEKYRGRVCIIVNVACKWGFTAQHYQQLQAMYDQLGATRGLSILAFPCNQFGGQEPGSNAEIKQYVTSNFGVTFDMYAKVEINGNDARPLFKYLKYKQGGLFGNFVKWNFAKFIVDRNGQPVERYAPNVEPFMMLKDLEKYW